MTREEEEGCLAWMAYDVEPTLGQLDRHNDGGAVDRADLIRFGRARLLKSAAIKKSLEQVPFFVLKRHIDM
jgi:hypothetical protein